MSDKEPLEAAVDLGYAALAIGAALVPLVLVSAVALVRLACALREGWGFRHILGGAFTVSVLVAVWAAVAHPLATTAWWTSDVVQGFGVLGFSSLAAWLVVRTLWLLAREWLEELRERRSWSTDQPSLQDRVERLQAKVRWLEHEEDETERRGGPLAPILRWRVQLLLARAHRQLSLLEAQLAGPNDEPRGGFQKAAKPPMARGWNHPSHKERWWPAGAKRSRRKRQRWPAVGRWWRSSASTRTGPGEASRTTRRA